MKRAKIENRNGIDYLTFYVEGVNSTFTLPVVTKGSREKSKCWTWNGSLENPTVRPSVLHTYSKSYKPGEYKEIKIHFWLNDGVCKCLNDCTDGNANKEIQLKSI